jgi:hypothetical protein
MVQTLVAIEDLDRLKQECLQLLLPLAIDTKVLPQGFTPAQMMASATAHPGGLSEWIHRPRPELERGEPKAVARQQIEVILVLVALARTANARSSNEQTWANIAADAAKLMTHTYGYLSAIRDNAHHISARATTGRKLIGDRKREAVRRAAAPLAGVVSKAKAATEIAEQVGLVPEVVRRYLSAEYPGESWNQSVEE